MKITVALLAALVLAGCSSSGGAKAAAPPAALRAATTLADSGDASALTFLRQESNSDGGCQRMNYYATVDPSVTGRSLAADELAFFVARSDLDQGDCGAFLYVFHSAAESNGSGYTAGAVVDDSRLLTVQTGPLGSSPYLSVSY